MGAGGEVVINTELVGVVIKRELVGLWSSKGSYWRGGHQRGAGGEVVINNELVGRWISKGS